MTELLDSLWWQAAGWSMVHFLWTGTVLCVLASIVRRLQRYSAPQFRYAVALLTLLLLTGLAGATTWYCCDQTIAQIAQQDFDRQRESSLPLPLAQTARPAVAWSPPATPEPLEESLATTPPPRLSERLGQRLAVWGEWLVRALPAVWLVGFPLVALALVAGFAGTRRLRSTAQEVSDERIVEMAERLRKLLGVSARVSLSVSERVTTPLVVGILRPLVLLPPAILCSLTPEQLEMILLHELAHVRRRDNLVNMLQRIVESILFFHPAVWWASRWVRLEREHCCDAVVLNHAARPQEYAETLASLALPELAPQYAAAAMANHQLSSRICHILDVEEHRMGISLRSLIVGLAILLAAGVGVWLQSEISPAQAAVPLPGDDGSASDADNAIIIAGDGVTIDENSSPVAQHSMRNMMMGGGGEMDAGHEYAGGGGAFGGMSSMDDMGGMGGEMSGQSDWSAAQATGPPNVAVAGDNPRAWASLTEDAQPEWLLLTFNKSVIPAAVMVYESFNPGALVRLSVYDERGREKIVWQGRDPVRPQNGKGVAVIPLPAVNFKTRNVKLYLDSPRVKGWNEIDAVALIDINTGSAQWASKAQCSSSYTQQLHPPMMYGGMTQRDRLVQRMSCLECHTTVRVPDRAKCPVVKQTRADRIRQLQRELQRLQHGSEPTDSRFDLYQQMEGGGGLDSGQSERDEIEFDFAVPVGDGETGSIQYSDLVPESAGTEPLSGSGAGVAIEDFDAAGAGGAEPEGDPDYAVDDQVNVLGEIPTLQGDQHNPTGAGGGVFQGTFEDSPLPQPTIQQLQQTIAAQQTAIEQLTNTVEQLKSQVNRRSSGKTEARQPGKSPAGAPQQNGKAGGGSPGNSHPSTSLIVPQNAIDRLILKQLQEQGLQPTSSEQMERYKRRIYLDLYGLPIPPEKKDAEGGSSGSGGSEGEDLDEGGLGEDGFEAGASGGRGAGSEGLFGGGSDEDGLEGGGLDGRG